MLCHVTVEHHAQAHPQRGVILLAEQTRVIGRLQPLEDKARCGLLAAGEGFLRVISDQRVNHRREAVAHAARNLPVAQNGCVGRIIAEAAHLILAVALDGAQGEAEAGVVSGAGDGQGLHQTGVVGGAVAVMVDEDHIARHGEVSIGRPVQPLGLQQGKPLAAVAVEGHVRHARVVQAEAREGRAPVDVG